jgi:hypothetical protein
MWYISRMVVFARSQSNNIEIVTAVNYIFPSPITNEVNEQVEQHHLPNG